MAYYNTVYTEGYQPKFGEAAVKHARALNNYLVYGVATDQILNPETTAKLPKQKVVKHQSSFQTLQASNGVIATTTVLCCEDDDEQY
jgi:hypothetical protein